MELLDLYDINRIKTTKTMYRGEKVPLGYYRLVIKIAIINDKNEMLIQKIQKKEDFISHGFNWNGRWDISVSGSATSGDTSAQAATRELKEELGLNYDFAQHRPSFTINWMHGFVDCYILQADQLNFDDLKLQASEVGAVKWATKAQILKLIAQNEFVLWKKEIIELLFKTNASDGILDIKQT